MPSSDSKNNAVISLSPYGFWKVFKSSENYSPYLQEAKAAANLANVVKELMPVAEEAVLYPSIPEFRGLEYVGYLIEKERYDSKKDAWIRINNIKIIGRLANKFIDTRVAYGYTYRYRIKSIVKLTYKGEADKYFSEYFSSEPTKNWLYVQATEKDPPPIVQTFKVVPSSSTKSIFLYWLPPSGDQRDVKLFNIYRRKKLGENWEKIVSGLENGKNMYEDKSVQLEQEYVYAITCIDIHGVESFLSSQIQAKLNKNFKNDKKEYPLKFVSAGGLTPKEINKSIKKFKSPSQKIIRARESVTLSISPELKEATKDYVLKIRSLDTGETKEITLNLKNLLQEPDRT